MRTLKRAALIGATCAALAPLSLAAAPAASADCATGVLPVSVVGSPDLKAHQKLGVYLWHNGNHYSLRATQAGSSRVEISGTVTVSRTLGNIRRVRLEKNDAVRVGPRRHVATFRFNNYGYIDGFDFTADCSRTVRVEVKVAGSGAAPAQVFLGRHRTNPTSVPFTIERAPRP